ncbi:hypothetical protein ZIOFF_075771 [Zingiber officinale]|uniref:Reverse transcriptase domain-containing protein n=1 Tax=Zingiber officinale TaxID=94328 RepID=A0A8J5C4J7_ZINOF|nr:hypothetical protein ZIOFF_075771 [Zingiber officinale]
MEVFGNIHDRVLQAEESMAAAEHAYDRDPTAQNRTLRSECQAHLFRVLDMEEDFWKQRAAIRWMGEGERNTKFFHSKVQKKRAVSIIFRIWEKGQCLDQPERIRESGVRYFQELLTGETVDSTAVDTNLIPTLVSTEDNLMLAALPSSEEVKQVVWSMCQDSAAGPDGFSVAFYRACWEIVGEDVLQAVLDFFRGAELPRGMASTTIVLIPKVDSAQRWRDFRPISLCNVSYKIISKLMAQRMASVLGKVISPAQSDFVPGRLISDNILMAQELDHKLNYHIRGGNQSVLSSLPVYLLQVIQPPLEVLRKLEEAEAGERAGDQTADRGGGGLIHEVVIQIQRAVHTVGQILEEILVWDGGPRCGDSEEQCFPQLAQDDSDQSCGRETDWVDYWAGSPQLLT